MTLDTHAASALAPAGSSAAITERYQHAVMNTFGPPKRVFVRGEGVHVFDAEGRRYLDLLSGLAVNALGHAHPQVLAAVTSQLSTLGHVSNFFATPAQVALAEKLIALTDGDADSRVFFTNSGTEANEAAFKLTRRTGRTRIISCEGAFHGRTMGALALTHNPKYREPFEPLPGEVTFVPYGDTDALAEALDDTVAAVVLEPIQGENGVVVPPAGYLAAARALTQRHGALLWIDEVQTGIGRTGAWLASAAELAGDSRPDIVTVAKGLGNGFPVGACLAHGRAASLLGPGAHGTTFGGNPVAALAGLAVVSVIERDGLLEHVTQTGERFRNRVVELGHPRIAGVRGRGFLTGIVLTEQIAPQVADAALDRGVIINAPRPDVLRVAPPLITTAAELDGFVELLPTLLETT